jgi:hypothetical protein
MWGNIFAASLWFTGRKRNTCALRAEATLVLTSMMLRNWSSRTMNVLSYPRQLLFFASSDISVLGRRADDGAEERPLYSSIFLPI